MVIRRPFFAACAVVPAFLAALTSGASAASVSCADQKPDNPVGYQVAAVHADQVQAPATTPPIAVLDSGVAQVPELEGRLRPGYNVSSGAQNTNDIDGHGTAVATVAAGAAGGVRGVSPTSPVIPIKVLDDRGEATVEDFTAGIRKAVALGAGVINISATGDPADVDAATAREAKDAIFAAVTKGVAVVAPTGNEGGFKVDVPAAFPHVIAVGATDKSGERAPFSNLGDGIDLVAPGADIVTAAPSILCSSGYGTVSGTSFSAPAVAGAAALLLAAHPRLDPAQLTDMLRLRGARNADPSWNRELGFGLLDVPAILAAPVPPADQPEVDDDKAWAAKHPPVLTTARRSRTLNGRVATHADPADVFRVRLKKGDRFRATLKGASDAELSLAFGTAKKTLKRGSPLTAKIGRSATYYVSVTVQQTQPAGANYRLSLKR